MKTLLLMRHAKSSWNDRKAKDRERQLTKQGRKNAREMGNVLLKNELIPQLVLSSSVERCRQTVQEVVEACEYQGKILFLDKLFMAEADVIVDALKLLPDEIERVLVVGHNPGLESMIIFLSGQIEALPSASVANISLTINAWKDLNKDSRGELIQLWRPKDLN
jgi:phosphohistidine phosphatase